MTTPQPDSLTNLQHEIQRLLGQCLIRLQSYERLLKSILELSDVSVHAHGVRPPTVEHHVKTNGKTLGHLVQQMLGSYLSVDTLSELQNDTLSPEEGNHARTTFRLSLCPGDFIQLETSLRELVDLRNALVHHFIDGRDFSSFEGCQSAQSDLNDALATIGKGVEQLQEIARNLVATRRKSLELLQTREIQAFLVEGEIPWEMIDIVSELRALAQKLAIDGWTPLKEAVEQLTKNCPDRRPEDYGCTNWKQVLHTSRLFDLRYEKIDGQRVALYRERPRPKHH